MKNKILNPVTPALKKTMRKMSDHQIVELIQVMLSADHTPADATSTYVAAYDEGLTRPSIAFMIENDLI